MRPFIQELPRHYGRSPQDAELQRVLELMAARAEADKDFTLEQLFPSTASGWGLKLWEEAYGLRPEAGQTERQRRERVIAKIRGSGTSTLERIKTVARAFSPGTVDAVDHSREYFFELIFSGHPGEMPNVTALALAIREMKPAHLDFLVSMFLRAKETAVLGLGGALAALNQLAVPEVPDKMKWLDALRVGGNLASITALPIQELPDNMKWTHLLHGGGVFAALNSLPVPEAPEGMKWLDMLRTGGAAAILTTVPIPAQT